MVWRCSRFFIFQKIHLYEKENCRSGAKNCCLGKTQIKIFHFVLFCSHDALADYSEI
jgi:hypothetical protein